MAMNSKRIIPVLLLKDKRLVKGKQFINHKYVGDPVNTVKIFSAKLVDELIILDISKSVNNQKPDYELLSKIASEAYMPLGYGGGVNNLKQMIKIIRLGYEKIILNTKAYYSPRLIKKAAKVLGSQSVVVLIDFKKNNLGKFSVYIDNGKLDTKIHPLEYAKKICDLGAGEIILSSIDREGTNSGYDIPLLYKISKEIKIPVVAMGGAGNLRDIKKVFDKTQISACAAGDMFTFYGPYKAVLINYRNNKEKKYL